MATGTGSYAGTVTSAATAAVAAVPITAIAAISGTAQVGVQLTAGALTPAGATASYQWRISSDGTTYTDIGGATNSTYTPVAADYSKFIKVVATGTGNYTGSVTSAATGVIGAAAPTQAAADAVFTANAAAITGGQYIVLTVPVGMQAWFAPTGQTISTFVVGGTMTRALAGATSIVAPANAGTYKFYLIDADHNMAEGSKILTVTNFGFNIGTGTITGYDHLAGGLDVVIPSTIGGSPVTAIADGAFLSKGITSVSIPDSITSIGDNAFADNSLTSVTIPGNTSVGTAAFGGTNVLTSITIGSGVTGNDYILTFLNTNFKDAYTAHGAGTYTGTQTGTWTTNITATASDNSIMMLPDNKTAFSADVFEFTLTNAELKDTAALSALGSLNVIAFTALPTGMVYTVANTSGKLVVTFSHAANVAIAADVPLNAVIKAAAVTGSGAADSADIAVSLQKGPAIGDSFGGGKIAYFLQSGDTGYVAGELHGLIVAIGDQSDGAPFATPDYQTIWPVGGFGIWIGYGSANTDLIISQNGAGTTYAAGIARAYNAGGYSDWFLPSPNELNKAYLNRNILGETFSGWYWTSANDSSNTADAYDSTSGQSWMGKTKDNVYKVRAMRSF